MTTFIRGANPIWSFVDLQGNQCDDTFYMYVLDNVIPYEPVTIFEDADQNVAWSNPIQFFANGTLPDNMYWDPDQIYRLEIRQNKGFFPPSQSDPLIYLIENYVPGNGGGTPTNVVGFFTDNQITNPQFEDILFNPTHAFTGTNPDPIKIGAGWELVLTGTGTVTLDRTSLNSTLANPTNAPYALHLTLVGWGSATLRQRFQQNGMLWNSTPSVNNYVSSTLTARIQGAPQAISARLVDSNNTVLNSLLTNAIVNSTFNEYPGTPALMPQPSNPDLPPAAYIDYQLILPVNVDIYLTSFQLIMSQVAVQFPYEQDTVDRQIDHTFHNYFNSIVVQPKDTFVSGWSFLQNPYQFNVSALSNVVTNEYVADQTIAITQQYVKSAAGNQIQTGLNAATGFRVVPLTATNQFGLLQYIDAKTMFGFWGYKVSALARVMFNSSHNTTVPVKMMLFYKVGAPGTLSQTDPISAWDENMEPVLNTGAGYVAIRPLNDPTYMLTNGSNYVDLVFNQFQLPQLSGGNQTLGVFFYSMGEMNSASTADELIIHSISLMPNDFAMETNSKTWDQVLNECQFYYEKSYDYIVYAGTPATAGQRFGGALISLAGLNYSIFGQTINIPYQTSKRVVPAVQFFSPLTGGTNSADVYVFQNGAGINSGTFLVSNFYQIASIGVSSVAYNANTNNPLLTGLFASTTNNYALITYQFTIDARIGV